MSGQLPPLIEVAIEPKSAADLAKLAAALTILALQDPALSVSTDRESGQTIIKGTRLTQLDQTVGRLLQEFGVAANIGPPQVAYRETLTRAVEVDVTHKKQIGAGGEFARVRILFEPLPAGSGYVFKNEIVGGAVPKECIPGVERGLNASRENGVLAGYPLIDFKATLLDGAYHEVDSTNLTFEIATRTAVRMLKERKAAALLEPIMNLDVTTPDDCLGGVIGDINSRRGQVQSWETRGEHQHLAALVPLGNLFDYDEALRALSRDRAAATMTFSHYDRVPWSTFDDDPPPFRPAMGMRA